MHDDDTSKLRDKIARLGRELETLSCAIKEEIDAHERWSSVSEEQGSEQGETA